MSGTAQRNLEQLDDGSWRLDFEASMLVASFNERSTFRTEGDTFLPQSYRLKRSGLGRASAWNTASTGPTSRSRAVTAVTR